MKKIININLSGRVVPIEDSAYESLQRYIESLRRYFANEEGRDEIINDIESRIAELMNDKIKKGASAVTDADIQEIINSMGRVEDFEKVEAEERAQASAAGQAKTESYTYAEPKRAKGRLYRDASDKFLGGVCSGIANYMNVDPAIVRLLFAIITFGGFGTGILIYIALWIILPVRNLDIYVGKRLFRNPDDKVISGVAGGLAAYFDKPSSLFRLIFAAPLILNILFGVLNGIFFMWERDIFPNIFIGSFSGTFILAYIILWIVLPEARSAFEKMEMRGEKVDVNRIRQNVKEGMGDFKNRMESWGAEVRTSAQQLGARATEFAGRGRTFAGEVSDTARPAAHGCLHAIGVIIKAFFIFVAGCITLSLFAGFMAIIFGGVAWWPVNNFLWTSSTQKMLAWGTLIFFIGVPIIGFMTWLVRRIVRVRSKSRYMGWIFGGLWTLGWFCAIFFGVSIGSDLRKYERVSSEISLAQPVNKLIVRSYEPGIRYTSDFRWIHHDNVGWNITEDSLKYNNVKLRVKKSDDSSFHINVYKYSAGSSIKDAQVRAQNIMFNAFMRDSSLNLGSSLGIDRHSKFRGQGVIVEVLVPEGKKIRFDESLTDAYDRWIVRRAYDRDGWGRNRYDSDWDDDYSIDIKSNVDYIMNAEGELDRTDKPSITDKENIDSRKAGRNRDSLLKVKQDRDRQIEELKRKNDKIDRMLEDGEDLPDSNSTGFKTKKSRRNEENTVLLHTAFVPTI